MADLLVADSLEKVYGEGTAATRALKGVDMRLPVNPRLLTVLSGFWSVQAGGHMGTALDHADIRGFEPHISVGPGPASN